MWLTPGVHACCCKSCVADAACVLKHIVLFKHMRNVLSVDLMACMSARVYFVSPVFPVGLLMRCDSLLLVLLKQPYAVWRCKLHCMMYACPIRSV
jgi:hypothetical protein